MTPVKSVDYLLTSYGNRVPPMQLELIL